MGSIGLISGTLRESRNEPASTGSGATETGSTPYGGSMIAVPNASSKNAKSVYMIALKSSLGPFRDNFGPLGHRCQTEGWLTHGQISCSASGSIRGRHHATVRYVMILTKNTVQ